MIFIAAAIAFALIASIVGLVFLLAIMGHTDTDVFKILVGALVIVGFTNIVGFYFGSSASSRVKDETINTLAVTGTGAGSPAVALAAAKAIAPIAAKAAAPAAAKEAAPPAAEVAAPPAAEIAVEHALAERREMP
jgi:hypothetical protein